MRSRIRSSIAAALILGGPVAAPWIALPAIAQPRAAPEIDALQVNADSGLASGSTLQFTVRGTPGGQARVQVQGSSVALALREGARGVYRGSYTLRPADRVDPANLIRASLAVDQRTTIANYSFPPGFKALASNAAPPRTQPPAQPEVQALRIERFAAEPVDTLEPGAELRFSLTGAPGASASVELPGIAGAVPMREVRPGQYTGSYTLRRQDKLGAAPVVATLRAGPRWVTAPLAQPFVVEKPPVAASAPPRTGDTASVAGTTLVFGTFDHVGGNAVDPRSVQLTIAGRDVTADTQVTPQSFSYRGTLPPGRHSVELTARDLAGNASRESWAIEVGTAVGAAPGNNTGTANGSDVVIAGRTVPGARVQAQVDAIAPPVGNRTAVAQRVGQQAVTAGPDGAFSVNLGAFQAAMGIRFEVSLVVNHGGQSAEQRLVLAPRPG